MEKEKNEKIAIYQSPLDNCRFTIAIPTYKRSDLLVEAVNCALNQTYTAPFEVLVSDNNPERDDETEVCMRQFEGNPRITYYKNKVNLGGFGNFNSLYANSKGEFVVMLHDDDILVTNYLEIMDAFLNKLNYDAIWPLYNPTKERPIQDIVEVSGRIKYRKVKSTDFCVTNMGGPPSGGTVRKEAFVKVGPFTGECWPFIDIEWASRAVQRIRCCRLLLPMLYYYWGDNVSMSERTFVAWFNKFQLLRSTEEKRMPFFWKPVCRLCNRAVLYDHNQYIRKWCGKEVLYETVRRDNPVFSENKVMDFVSKAVQFLLKAYIKLFQTKSVKLN